MTKKVRIESGDTALTAELYENETASQIYAALPIEGVVNRWGEEIYFSIPLQLDEAPDARQEMDVGELGYWPPGNAFCIFFGPTPVSSGEAPRAASNVNPFGRISEGAAQLTAVRDGETIRITAVV